MSKNKKSQASKQTSKKRTTKRTIGFEQLEGRRLLAADCGLAAIPAIEAPVFEQCEVASAEYPAENADGASLIEWPAELDTAEGSAFEAVAEITEVVDAVVADGVATIESVDNELAADPAIDGDTLAAEISDSIDNELGESDLTDQVLTEIDASTDEAASSEMIGEVSEDLGTDPRHLNLSDGMDGFFGAINADNPTETLDFTPSEDGRIDIVMSSSFGDSAASLSVVDSSGSVIETKAEGLAGFNQLSFDAEAGENYLLIVSSDAETTEGQFQVTVGFEKHVDQHADIIGADSTELELSDNTADLTGRLETAGDTDTFRFTAASDGEVVLQLNELVDDERVDLDIEVQDADGNMLADGATNRMLEIGFDVENGREYFISLTAGENQSGEYGISLELEPASTPSTDPVDEDVAVGQTDSTFSDDALVEDVVDDTLVEDAVIEDVVEIADDVAGQITDDIVEEDDETIITEDKETESENDAELAGDPEPLPIVDADELTDVGEEPVDPVIDEVGNDDITADPNVVDEITFDEVDLENTVDEGVVVDVEDELTDEIVDEMTDKEDFDDGEPAFVEDPAVSAGDLTPDVEIGNVENDDVETERVDEVVSNETEQEPGEAASTETEAGEQPVVDEVVDVVVDSGENGDKEDPADIVDDSTEETTDEDTEVVAQTPIELELDEGCYLASGELSDSSAAYMIVATEDGQISLDVDGLSRGFDTKMKVTISHDGQMMVEGTTNDDVALRFNTTAGSEYLIEVATMDQQRATFDLAASYVDTIESVPVDSVVDDGPVDETGSEIVDTTDPIDEIIDDIDNVIEDIGSDIGNALDTDEPIVCDVDNAVDDFFASLQDEFQSLDHDQFRGFIPFRGFFDRI